MKKKKMNFISFNARNFIFGTEVPGTYDLSNI